MDFYHIDSLQGRMDRRDTNLSNVPKIHLLRLQGTIMEGKIKNFQKQNSELTLEVKQFLWSALKPS